MVGTRHEDPRWAAVLDDIKGQVNRQQFETWFREVQLLSLSPELARLGVPSVFLRDWIQNYYLELIRASIQSVTGCSPSVEVSIVETGDAPHATEAHNGSPPAGEHAWAAVAVESDQDGLRLSSQYPGFRSDVILNPHYTFDGFVVGPSNKLPHAAALAVSAQPATAYNPLFLHGSVGLGKSHLLQAICHAVLSRRKDLRILYLSCETFTNQFIAAVKSGNIGNFRYRYRHVDVLVIDDIHFLAKKEQTQEEFFHTFNTLYNSGGQIVLSSDSSPKEIPTLGERLVSRFKWGLVAEIEPPDYETRVLIVKRKSKLRGKDFPDDVCELVADRITANIRELEGAVLKVLSVADIHERPVDIEIAREALRSLTSPAKRRITVEKIIEAVTRYYDVRQADLQGRRRSKSIAFPRQVCMFLARLLTNHSLEEIGGYFGGRDHTTVIYATEKIEKMKTGDSRFKEELDRLIHDLQS